jgi:hypothetical protein
MAFIVASKKSILYFTEPDEVNTDETLKAVKERADEFKIRDIIVASTRGGSGLKAVAAFKDYNVVVVTHSTGFREPGVQELSEEMAEKIKAGGGRILTATHAFSGVNRAIQKKFDTVYPTGIIAQTLRLFSQGMKVCVEITAMAADAGMIPVDKYVVAIAGSGRGADTAIVVKPATAHNLFDMVIKEIITKPSFS